MGVSLYTFRVLLQLLGVDDYGTYNVIGGIVVLFSFLGGAMTQSTQRYLSYYMGKNDNDSLKKIFSMSCNMYFLLGLLILVLSESIGLWFINTYLEFPDTTDKFAVNTVYQCTVVTLLFNILQLPFQSAIIAYERMNFFAYLSVFDVTMKLLVVFVLFLLPSGRLIGYAATLTGIAFTTCYIYRHYCVKHFEICRYQPVWEKSMLKELTSFSGWNLLGSASNVAAQQGLNILFNMFIGVTINAAMGVSNQVCNAINSFVTNFQTAFNPQIIKFYAANQREHFFNLIFRASRVSFMLLFIIGLPVIVCCNAILSFWLTDIPPYTLEFIRLMLVFNLIDAISGPLWISAQASGKIRGYMLLVSGMIFINLPLAYVVLKLKLSPIYVIAIRVLINFIIANVRVIYLKSLIGLSVCRYYKSVMLPIFLTGIVSAPIPFYLHSDISGTGQEIALFMLTFCLALISSWFILLTGRERGKIMQQLMQLILRLKTHHSSGKNL